MRLRQEGQTVFFQMDHAEDIHQEIFEFRIESAQLRDLVEEIVVILQQFLLSYNFV